jgi:Fic family protein
MADAGAGGQGWADMIAGVRCFVGQYVGETSLLPTCVRDMSMMTTFQERYGDNFEFYRHTRVYMDALWPYRDGYGDKTRNFRHISGAQSMPDPARPYNDLPLLPPSAEMETRAVLKKCVAARTALAELRLAGHLIPDQSVLVQAIPNLEARDSSAVENIVTTIDALFREANLKNYEASPATREAARYRNALYAAIEAIRSRPLSTRIAVEICRTITGIDLDVRCTPGTTLTDSHTGEVIYTPPEGEALLRDLLANWERFAHENPDLDPLVRMAVMHYQFEAIHPFPDGNGRTGRILNVLGLMQEGLLDLPTLYLSRYILQTRGEYYRRLGEVTFRQQWEPWILYILTGVEQTSAWTMQKIRAIRALMDETTRYVRGAAPKMPHAVIEQIFTRPYCRIANLVEAKIAARHTASAYLKELVELGVLEEEKVGRDKIFLHRKYIDVLFAEEHTFRLYL